MAPGYSEKSQSHLKGIRGVESVRRRCLLPSTVAKPRSLIAIKIPGMTIQSYPKRILFSNTDFLYVS